MARIETQGAIQLTLPEASTVYVFPRRQEAKAALGNVFPQSDKPSLLEQPLINAIVQDRLDRGADDMDGNGHLARFESRLRELKSQDCIDKFCGRNNDRTRPYSTLTKPIGCIPLKTSIIFSAVILDIAFLVSEVALAI